MTKTATRMAASGLLAQCPDDRDNGLVMLWLTDVERRYLLSALTGTQRTKSGLLEGPTGEPVAGRGRPRCRFPYSDDFGGTNRPKCWLSRSV
ncbi:hypothetical protein [Streptomyces sp. NPDC001480]|uniref:hypothetical protein n=1 Tax=Streptomyces sp. NPDC001480 TaxID=3364577 RepID=UPI0036B0C7EF